MQGVERYQNFVINQIFKLVKCTEKEGVTLPNGVTYYINEGLNTNALMLLKYILQTLTTIPQDKNIILAVMPYCRDKRGNDYQIKNDLKIHLEALRKTSMKGYGATKTFRDGKERNWAYELNTGLIDKWFFVQDKATGENVIEITLSDNLRDFLVNSGKVMDDNNIRKLDNRHNPNSFYIDDYLRINNRINRGKDNQNVVSVAALLEHLPFIPSIEKVREWGKSPKKAIIFPVVRDMEKLKDLGVIKNYEICKKSGEKIDNYKRISWKDFIQSKIKYKLAVGY